MILQFTHKTLKLINLNFLSKVVDFYKWRVYNCKCKQQEKGVKKGNRSERNCLMVLKKLILRGDVDVRKNEIRIF